MKAATMIRMIAMAMPRVQLMTWDSEALMATGLFCAFDYG
jgi:hypothetical protein